MKTVVPEIATDYKRRATFNRTTDNVGWAQWTWNPVTGCLHGCDYCYARRIAMRFTGHFNSEFHADRLDAPANTKPIPVPGSGGNRVFVCSMGDLFGAWVPEEWIRDVLHQVELHPEWTFLFLTKNPHRYESLLFPDNAWIGATVDTQARVKPTEEAFASTWKRQHVRTFVSCEPLLEPVRFSRPELFDWFLIGGKSEGEKKIQPPNSWVASIIAQAGGAGKKWWCKDNLYLQECPE